MCSINKFITDNVDLNTKDEGLVEKYKDLLYDLYERYTNKDTTNLLNDIYNIVDNIILKEFNINLIVLILYLKRLKVGNKKYYDIIEQMKLEIKPVNSDKKVIKTVSNMQLCNMFEEDSENLYEDKKKSV